MELSNIIYGETILLDAALQTRTEVFSYFSDVLYDSHLISDRKPFINGLNAKEEEISTAIGYEIAVPHVQSSCILYPLVSFVRSENGVFWENEENSKVKLIFLIAVPKNLIGEHINILASLSRRLMNEAIRAKLLRMREKDEIYQILA